MKLFFLFIIVGVLLSSGDAKAQMTAMDFNRKDCNGNMQHLYEDLDAGHVVILEFFMQGCSPCITAGNKLEAMKTRLLARYPGKIKSYAIGYNNSYTCESNAKWVSSNGFTSIPMDSGAAQIAHYGGMGMPTVVILGGGTSHTVIGAPYIGFVTSDTTKIASDIRTSLATSGVTEDQVPIAAFTVYPNPSTDLVTMSFPIKETGSLVIDILDVTGKQVAHIMKEKVHAGSMTKSFSTAGLPNGRYSIRVRNNMKASQFTLTVIH